MSKQPSLVTPPHSRRDFKIVIICALELEADAILRTLDVNWNDLGHRYGRTPQDENTYTAGVIGAHNVVLAHMPGMGVTSAATVANNVRYSFESIQLALVVGVCGGVPQGPNNRKDIRLGDLVIGTDVVQYDFGRQYPAGFEPKYGVGVTLNRPHRQLGPFVAKLSTRYYTEKLEDLIAVLICERSKSTASEKYPGRDKDQLYQADYVHKHRTSDGVEDCKECASSPDHICAAARASTCEILGCDPAYLEHRPTPAPDETRTLRELHHPTLHFGKIGSGNTVVKSGQHRAHLASQHDLIAFEMEGAGISDSLPTIVVKGVCDYADSHKNKAWQAYAAQVAAAGVYAILMEWELEDSSPTRESPRQAAVAVSTLLGAWHLPYERDPDFVPRGDIMKQISIRLSSLNGRRRVALTGLGGVGKSQIAIEYAYQLRDHDSSVSIFWVHASNVARVRASYQAIAHSCQIPGYNNPNADYLDLVHRWLQSQHSGRWLLVMDNVDDINLIRLQGGDDSNFSLLRFIPQNAAGSVLFTSRDRQLAFELTGRHDCVLPVSSMLPQEAIELVRRKLVDIADNKTTDDYSLTLLSTTLDFLPLAINQAAAYITRRRRMTVEKYVKLFINSDADSVRLLTEESVDLQRDWEAPHSVARAWELAFVQIESQNRTAIEILSLMALFNRQDVPEVLLRGEFTEDEFEEAIETLLGYAVITANAEGSLFSMHRLVQLVTRAWCRSETERWMHCQERALGLLDQSYPHPTHENRAQCAMLEPHAESALLNQYQTTANELKLMNLLIKRARHHRKIGNYNTAQNFLQSAEEKSSHILGPEHSITMNVILKLGAILRSCGKYDRAEQLLQTVLATSTRSLGPEHEDTLSMQLQLGRVKQGQGKYKEAEELFRAVLAVEMKTLGPEHEANLITMSDLASALEYQKLYNEAAQLYQRVIELQIKAIGQRHLDTLVTMCGLARMFHNLGRHVEAEQLYNTTSALQKEVLGPEHPHTLTALHGVAVALWCQGQIEEAQRLLRHVLKATEKVLGLDHPDTSASAWVLAAILRDLEQYTEAEQLFRRAYTNAVAWLGDGHPDTQKYHQDLQIFIAEMQARQADQSTGKQDGQTSAGTIEEEEEEEETDPLHTEPYSMDQLFVSTVPDLSSNGVMKPVCRAPGVDAFDSLSDSN